MMAFISEKRGLISFVVGLVCMGMVLAIAPAEPGLQKIDKKEVANKDQDKSKMPKELKEAMARVRAKFQNRLNAALKAMAQGYRKGTPIEAAEAMANAGLEQGLDTKDFEPLGRFVAEQHAKGLKGEGLAKAIAAEVHRRKEVSKKAREVKKEGRGKGKAPRSEFAGLGGNAHHIVYLIDRSGSMFDVFDAAKSKVYNSVKNLQPVQDFHVIMFADGDPVEKKPMALTPPTNEHKLALAKFLDIVRAERTTNPIKAINRAFDVLAKANKRPGKIIYMLTDGAFPNNKAVLAAIRARNIRRDVQINTFLYGWKTPKGVKVMSQIADENGGKYRYVSPEE